MYGPRNSELSTCLFQFSHKTRQTMLLYAYFTPKVDFKRKFNHHQSFLYEWRLTARTIRKFRIGPSIRIESRIGRTIRNRSESRSFAGPYFACGCATMVHQGGWWSTNVDRHWFIGVRGVWTPSHGSQRQKIWVENTNFNVHPKFLLLMFVVHMTLWYDATVVFFSQVWGRAVPDLFFSNLTGAWFSQIWSDKSDQSRTRIFKLTVIY